MAIGEIAEQPLEPLARVLVAAYNQAGRQIATASDPATAEAEYRQVMRTLVAGMAGPR